MKRIATPWTARAPLPPWLGAALFLPGGGTPEYRAGRIPREADWIPNIPPVHRRRLVTEYRSERRPTGETRRETQGKPTICQPVTEAVQVPCQAIETVDIRKAQRDAQIAACTARNGNSKCET